MKNEDELDQALIEMKKALHCCYVFAEYEYEIGQEPENHQFPEFWGICQMACQRSLHIGIYNIFFKTEYNITCSVPEVIKALKIFPILNRSSLEQNAENFFSIKISGDLEDEKYKNKLIKILNDKKPTEKNNTSLKLIHECRNKKFAHIEAGLRESFILPSLDETQALIKWADNFVDLVYAGYLNHSPANIQVSAARAIKDAQKAIAFCRKPSR